MAGAVVRTRAEIGQARRSRTRSRLISAAAQVVAQFGDRKATIDDFIRAAGVARGTFYNCFTTREELLDALWSHIGKDPFLDIQRLSRTIEDPAERLVCEARLVFARARLDSTWGWLVYSLSSDAGTLNGDLRSYPTDDLKAGYSARRFEFDDLGSARDLVVSTVRTGLKALLAERRDEGYEEALCLLILCALGVARSEARWIVTRPLPGADAKRKIAAADAAN